jgi:hypothetical protein
MSCGRVSSGKIGRDAVSVRRGDVCARRGMVTRQDPRAGGILIGESSPRAGALSRLGRSTDRSLYTPMPFRGEAAANGRAVTGARRARRSAFRSPTRGGRYFIYPPPRKGQSPRPFNR